MEITESNKCTVIKESTENFANICDIFLLFNFHEWMNDWTAIAIGIQCASLSFPFLFTCWLFSIRSHSSTEKKRNDAYFVYSFFILTIVYWLRRFSFLSFGKNHNAKNCEQLKRRISLEENLWMCGLWHVIYYLKWKYYKCG